MTIKLGIVGIGYGQHVLLPVFQADERVSVSAICASTTARAREVADQYGIAGAYGDWRAMLPAVDAVAVAVPPQAQPEIVIAALAVGKPVFAEKAIATTVRDAEQMVAAANQSGLPNVVDFEFPEIAAWRVAQEMIQTMGALRHIEVIWDVENYASRMRLDNWKTQAAGGGVLYNYMSHVFYYLEWFTGERIGALTAHLTKAPTDPRHADTVDMVTLAFESGLAANVTVSSHAFMGSGHRLAFYGDDATLILENRTRDYIHGFTVRYAKREQDDTFRDIALPPTDISADGRRLATGALARRWVSWIVDGTPTTPTLANGLRVQRLIAAAQQSHQKRGWVDV